MDIKLFEDIWKPYKTNKDNARQMWNKWAEKFKEQKSEADFNDPDKQLMDYLNAKGILNGTDILDIGCGIGKHAARMAQTAKSVTGVDISQRMVEIAKEDAQEAGVTNVDFRLMDWEGADIAELGWEKKFDLVFASKTLAVSARQGLEKMMSASKGCCFYGTFARRYNPIRNKLSETVEGLSKGRCGSNEKTEEPVFLAFNILWLMGYFPDITFVETGWSNDCDVEESIDLSFKFYEVHQALTSEQKSGIEKELRKIAVNGKIRETTEATIAWLYWKV